MKLCTQKQQHVSVIRPARIPTGKSTSPFHQNVNETIAQHRRCCPLSNFPFFFSAFLSLFLQNYFLWAICKFSRFKKCDGTFAWILVVTYRHKKNPFGSENNHSFIHLLYVSTPAHCKCFQSMIHTTSLPFIDKWDISSLFLCISGRNMMCYLNHSNTKNLLY